MNEVLKAIAGRRSTRQFKPDQISDDDLRTILEAGLQAPSGHNEQSWYFLAIQKKPLIDEISEGSKKEMQKHPIDWIASDGKNEKLHIFYRAPTVVIVAARKDAISPQADVCAAIENMMIAAESLKIGSCWNGFVKFYFNDRRREERLGVPEGYEVHYGLCLGYKPDDLRMNPPHRKYAEYFKIIR